MSKGSNRAAPRAIDGIRVRAFRSQADWHRWLHRHHASSDGIWVRYFKKGSGVASMTFAEALEEALCYGWIDSQARSLDERSYLQKYTPRRARSVWSKINRGHAERLIRERRMQPAGLREIERAKADGRWAAAYDSPARATVPADLKAALGKNRKAQKFFETLKGQNRYAILHRLQIAKRPETRARRIATFVAMLAEGKKIYP